MRDGLFPERVAMVNVEGGCATASMALNGAWKDVLSGQAEVSLAIGIEKTYIEGDREATMKLFSGGIDQMDPDEWRAYYAVAGKRSGKGFDPEANDATLFMDTYAMQAAFHMAKYGTTQRQIAEGASKNHHHGSLNAKA